MNILRRKTVCCSHFSWNFPTRLLTQHLVITRLTLKHCSAAEVPGLLSGTASRFAVQKRFGALGLTRLPDHDTCLALLSESFRYAALYELRSNLFDYHLEEDRLVTADNWKDTIRFHFVQYQHIYEQALDGFYAAVLSRKLLRAEFRRN